MMHMQWPAWLLPLVKRAHLDAATAMYTRGAFGRRGPPPVQGQPGDKLRKKFSEHRGPRGY